MALTETARSNSLRSLASNSSSSSGVSLQRANRTKTTRSRSRTVTSRDPPPTPTEPLPSPPATTDGKEESTEASVVPSTPQSASYAGDSDDEGSIIAYLTDEDPGAPVTPKAASAPPGTPTSPTPLVIPRKVSGALRRVGLAEIDVLKANARDSMTTQQSFTSHQTSGTSYYPPSSTTGTVDSLLTPSTSRSFEPEIRESPELDTDDVSYRLRLLVNNNYFLPPAHAKPQRSDFLHSSPEVQKKSALPFLDIFKINKAKSKPTTPTAPFHSPDGQPPILRTTSDCSPAPARPPAVSPVPNASPGFLDRAPRVVVIKEKVQDIAQAAKKVEEELNLKDVFERHSQTGVQFTDVIDPTDTVDLPPPSSEYPFAVQASALHGLGVNESVGVALLADRILPSTQNLTALDRSEEDWRRALLHDAVSLSLHSNLSGSFTSPITSSPANASPAPPRFTTSPTGSIHSGSSSKRPKSPADVKARLEQRIISNPVIESPCASPPPIQNISSVSRGPRKDRANTVSIQSFIHPLRAETPLTPHTPLAPAPRQPTRHFQKLGLGVMSSSKSVNGETPSSVISDNSKSIRKVISTPMLHDSLESRLTFMMTPPPGELTRDSLQSTSRSLYSSEEIRAEKATFSAARPSVTLSTAEDQYASDYSAQSAAASAFFDALTHLPDPAAQNFESRSTLGYQTAKTSARFSPVAMFNALSPPPRTESPLSFRSASPGRRLPSPLAFEARPAGQSFLSLGSEPSVEIMEPEPTTPPLPISDRPDSIVMLRKASLPVAGPSSPPSFFDTLQSQPNAIDDLDSSEEDDEVLSSPTPFFRSTDGGSTLMRLGNYSSPHVSRTANTENDPIPSVPRGRLQRRTSDSKGPVGFSAPRKPFFTEVKEGQLTDSPPMLPDYYGRHHNDQKQQQRPHTSAGTTNTDGDNLDTEHRLKQQRSLKRLDGLVLKHMETEKDTIRRITNTARTDQNKR